MERGLLLDVFWLTFFLQAANIIYALNPSSQVCVVGGGIAGLAAAQKMISGGFANTKVIEAGAKVGGRAMGASIPGVDGSFDLGVQRVLKGNPLYDVAVAQRLLMADTLLTAYKAKKTSYFTAMGCLLNNDLVQQLEDFSFELDDEAKRRALVAGNTDSVGTLYKNAYAFYLKTNPSIPDKLIRYYDAVFDQVKKAFEYSNGVGDWNNCSGKQISLLKDDVPGEYLGKDGFQGIINYYATQVGKANILLNTKVSTIAYADDQKARLTFTNNQIMDCDFVIVTIPLSVLKNTAPTMFVPPLPQTKLTVLNNLGCDPTDTFVVTFASPFWKKEMNAFNLIRVKEDFWNCKVFDYKESMIAKTIWYLQPHPIQSNSVIGYVGGGSDAAYFEAASSETIMQAVTDLLKMFMSNLRIPKPVSLIRSNSGLNQNIGCAASYYTTKCDQPGPAGLCDRSELEKPITISKAGVVTPVIYFAGEAVSSDGFGRATGAVTSGIKAATAVIALPTI